MTESIEGDWLMLIEEEPIGTDNRVYTLRGGLVLDTAGHEAGFYSSPEAGHYRITIGETICEVRSVEGGTGQTLTGSSIFGDWSEPVVFSRVRYDIRPPYGIRGA